MAIDPKKVTKEQMERALELLEKEQVRKDRIAKGEIKGSKKWSELTDAEKAKFKDREARRRAKIAVLIEKATAKGITVSDQEVDKYLASKK